MAVMVLGEGLPAADYNPGSPKEGDNLKAYQEDHKDNFWRMILLFPIIINILMLLNFVVNIGAEPIMYALSIDDDEEAMKLIDKVYHESVDR